MQVLNISVLSHIAGGASPLQGPPRHPNSFGTTGQTNKVAYPKEDYEKFYRDLAAYKIQFPDYVDPTELY